MPVSLTDARSAQLYRRALEYLPGGVNSPVRAMRSIGRDPLFIERGQGSEIVDVDGNRYVDWGMSWGPLIHGHGHPEIVTAVVDAARRGTTFGAPTRGEVDGLRAGAASGLATHPIPASPGVPAAATQATVVVPWNDPETLRAATAEHELAAIIAEPFPANMGVVPSCDGFLELLRERADATGALLIFDEVITGFRVASGGAQELCAMLPDLTIMGKILGGGLPAAAFGGPIELMDRLAPPRDVYQAGPPLG